MAKPAQKSLSLTQEEMRLCYVFSSSDTQNSPEVTARAEEFLKSRKAHHFDNRYLACGTLERLPSIATSTKGAPTMDDSPSVVDGQAAAEKPAPEKLPDEGNVGALPASNQTETGPSPQSDASIANADAPEPKWPATYLFLMKFRYEALEEVAENVLLGRIHFQDYLSRTLTLLEYPRFRNNDEKALGLTPSEAHSTLRRVGILLIQSKTGVDGIQGKTDLEACCEKGEKPDRRCVEVLGPFDYIVEFPAETHEELREMFDRVRKQMKGKFQRMEPMLCTIFHPKDL